MKLGYARASTTDQDLTIQRDRLYEAGCEKLFEEKTSGARKMRPALERLLAELRADDVVVVTRLDRLARSTAELLRIAPCRVGCSRPDGSGARKLCVRPASSPLNPIPPSARRAAPSIPHKPCASSHAWRLRCR